MTAPHTPGPWHISPASHPQTEGYVGASFQGGAMGSVCRVFSHLYLSPEESAANLYLIAAAPDLLEACLAIVAWDDAEKNAQPFTDDNGAGFYARIGMCSEAFSKARAAIAKATEQQSGGL